MLIVTLYCCKRSAAVLLIPPRSVAARVYSTPKTSLSPATKGKSNSYTPSVAVASEKSEAKSLSQDVSPVVAPYFCANNSLETAAELIATEAPFVPRLVLMAALSVLSASVTSCAKSSSLVKISTPPLTSKKSLAN